MGYRGPTPKPSVIEIAEGRPGKRPINEREPKYAAIVPDLAECRCDMCVIGHRHPTVHQHPQAIHLRPGGVQAPG